MWIRTINTQDEEILINLDKIESIQFLDQKNETILVPVADPEGEAYIIKGTPDRIFELLEQKGMVEVLPLPKEEEEENSISDKEWADWAETMFTQEYLNKKEN